MQHTLERLEVFDDAVKHLIMRELEAAMEDEWKKVTEDFTQNIDRRKAEILPRIALMVFHKLDFEKMGKTITLRLESQ